jgi:hypothetical protein
MRTIAAMILFTLSAMLATASIATPEWAKGKSARDEAKGKGKKAAPARFNGRVIAAHLTDQILIVVASGIEDRGDDEDAGRPAPPPTTDPVPAPAPAPTPEPQPAPVPEPTPTPAPTPVPDSRPDSEPANPSDPVPTPTPAQASQLKLTGQITVRVDDKTVLRTLRGQRVTLVDLVRALTMSGRPLPVTVSFVEDMVTATTTHKVTAIEVVVRGGAIPELRPSRR